MKRDMDLIRAILLRVEDRPDTDGSGALVLEFEEFTPGEVSYHVRLLAEAGLIEARERQDLVKGAAWYPSRLTWDGHEFLDDSRDETRWEQAKKVGKSAGGFGAGLLKTVLGQLAAEAIKGVLHPH